MEEGTLITQPHLGLLFCQRWCMMTVSDYTKLRSKTLKLL